MLQTLVGSPNVFALQRVSTLTSASQAVDREAIDAILLDLGLPDSSGIETVDRLVAIVGERIPIVVLTSHVVRFVLP